MVRDVVTSLPNSSFKVYENYWDKAFGDSALNSAVLQCGLLDLLGI